MGKSFGELVASATVQETTPYWLPNGQYLVRINEVKVINNKNNVDCFIVTGENLESSHPDTPVGQECSWIVSMSHMPAASNIKQFVSAILDEDPDEIDPAAIEAIISSENPLNGQLVQLETFNKITKEKKQDFTVHKWKPATKNQKAEYGIEE
jgi:hypothetical protein